MIVSIRALRKFVVLALALLVLGGCGGDDEPTPPATQEATTSEETTATSESEATAVDPETETLPNDGDGTGTGTGESDQGGAGDEQAAETLALFTGKDGDISPRTVRVPAFISIRVELRSADGADYALRFEGRSLKVGETINSLGVRFDGLRPGAKLIGRASTGAEVTVEATAEPGP
jgi:ABC-type transport system substrate-binding protein